MNALLVSTDKELQQILELQKMNLRGVNDQTTEKEQGFVTVTHTLKKLQQLNGYERSVIVKDNQELAGYALVMTIECSTAIPELFPLFERLNKLMYNGRPVSTYRFYTMGQICVAATYRGRGVFDMLYRQHKEAFSQKYDFVITSIATRNVRSIRAHERIGFKKLEMFTDDLDEWMVVIWDWNTKM
jgi:ribosomal protein S18 acetylase RimI-like enzyme